MFWHQLFVDTSNYETHYLPLYSNQLVKGKVERLAGNLRWEFWEKLDNESSGDVKILWALTDAEYQWKIEPVFHNMRSIVLPWNYKKCSSAHIRSFNLLMTLFFWKSYIGHQTAAAVYPNISRHLYQAVSQSVNPKKKKKKRKKNENKLV